MGYARDIEGSGSVNLIENWVFDKGGDELKEYFLTLLGQELTN